MLPISGRTSSEFPGNAQDHHPPSGGVRNTEPHPTGPGNRSRLARLLLGDVDSPRWARPALWAVLALSAVLNSWALSINGWANTYYSATVLGMTRSWKALFFGAFDEQSFITVDKPPLALWVQALSARAFGFNSWSLLLPQAVAGVLAVWVVHHVVRRGFGHVAATVSAAVLAVTPIAVAMARHNNPDGVVVLLLALALWAASNAIRSGRLGPLLWCAAAIGLAFNAKMLQAYFVVPVIALVYLGAVRLRWPRKLLNLAVSGVVLFVSSTFWMFAVDLTPASARPYVGGSTNNTVRDLLLGYNGFGRVLGQGQIMSPGMMPGGGPPGGGGPGGPGGSGGPGGGPGPGGPGGGPPAGGPGGDGGLTRLFSDQVASQASWLLPLAVFCAVAVLVLLRGRGRHDPQRADFLLWGGTLLVTTVVFSAASGIWHPYYTVALGAPIAAVVGPGMVAMVRLARTSRTWGWLLPASLAVTGAWCAYLLGSSDEFGALAVVVAVLSVLAALAAAFVVLAPRWRSGRLLPVAAVVGLIALLIGPTAYSASTVTTPTSSTFPSAGPSGGGPGTGGPGGSGPPNGGPPGPGAKSQQPTSSGSEEPGPEVIDYVREHQNVGDPAGEKWLLAVVGTMVAAPITLDTGQPVMAVGGYNGNDPAPTAEQLREHVRAGELRYVWTSGSSGVHAMGGGVDTRVVDESMSWVAQHCTMVDPADDGSAPSSTNLYDCAIPR